MSEGLTQRRLNDRHHTIFYIYWDGLRVGTISKREGNPPGTPGWQWMIGVSGQLSGFSDTAGSYEEARAIWKEKWPSFRDAQSYTFWKKARETQDYSDKINNIWLAEKLTSDPMVRESAQGTARHDGPDATMGPRHPRWQASPAARMTNWKIPLASLNGPTPVKTPEGKILRTVGDAAKYAEKLGKAKIDNDPLWREAVKQLIFAAESEQPLPFTWLAVKEAIYGKTPPNSQPPRLSKEEIWREKRKKARRR